MRLLRAGRYKLLLRMLGARLGTARVRGYGARPSYSDQLDPILGNNNAPQQQDATTKTRHNNETPQQQHVDTWQGRSSAPSTTGSKLYAPNARARSALSISPTRASMSSWPTPRRA